MWAKIVRTVVTLLRLTAFWLWKVSQHHCVSVLSSDSVFQEQYETLRAVLSSRPAFPNRAHFWTEKSGFTFYRLGDGFCFVTACEPAVPALTEKTRSRPGISLMRRTTVNSVSIQCLVFPKQCSDLSSAMKEAHRSSWERRRRTRIAEENVRRSSVLLPILRWEICFEILGPVFHKRLSCEGWICFYSGIYGIYSGSMHPIFWWQKSCPFLISYFKNPTLS